MALEADRNQIAVFIGAAVSFGFDVVNGGGRDWPAVRQALLTQMSITLQDAGSDNVPLTAIAALVATQPPLMLLPAFITMRLAVARAVSSCACTAALAASSRN